MEAPRGRPRDQEVDEKIVEAVQTLLSEKGFAGTTIEQVSKQTGLGRPTIYRRFKNRNIMIHEVVKQLLEESRESLIEHVDPYTDVRSHLINTIHMLTRTPVGEIFRAVLSEIPRDQELAKMVSDIGEDRRKQLMKAVNRAVKAGVLSFPGDTTIAVDGIVGAIYLRYLMSPEPIPFSYADKLLKPAKRVMGSE